MQVEVNTDSHVQGSTGLSEYVEDIVGESLARFRERITRVEVHFSDENGKEKGGGNDKHCVMEARLAGFEPIIVRSHASSVQLAIDSAVEKLEKSVKRTLKRLEDPKGRTPFGGEPFAS